MAVTRLRTRAELLTWLHQLDSYTNAEFGRARSLAAMRGECVACGGEARDTGTSGLCATCAAKRRPDHSEVVLFRPLRKPPDGRPS